MTRLGIKRARRAVKDYLDGFLGTVDHNMLQPPARLQLVGVSAGPTYETVQEINGGRRTPIKPEPTYEIRIPR